MKGPRSVRWRIRRLFEIRNRFDPTLTDEKQALLEALAGCETPSAVDLERLHASLAFIRAFPDSAAHHRLARLALGRFARLVGALGRSRARRLDDSGIAGTPVRYVFSFAACEWLTRRFPGAVSIDWNAAEDTERLDDLLHELIELTEPSTTDFFDGGRVSTREWLDLMRGGGATTDLDWLLGVLRGRARSDRVWARMYDTACVPVTWDLGDSRGSKSLNVMPVRRIHGRAAGMRGRDPHPKRAIREPVESMRVLEPGQGARLIDVAMAAMATRHRETNHFNHASAREVYLADVGAGVSIAVTGLRPEHRFVLECTMGYLILSNGVPVGYGGASVVFGQANTGINILDEYRGSEAAFLWTQVMRVFHALFACTRFIANPYQIGGDNPEALLSGAFWFYYRLGYRPADPAVARLAEEQWRALGARRRRGSTLKTLRRLASCDMHLVLPGARPGELFEEDWIGTCAELASRALAKEARAGPDGAGDRLAARLVRALGVRAFGQRPATERLAFRCMAPLVAALDLSAWSPDDRRSLGELMLAKGHRYELGFARRLREHTRFRRALANACRRAERHAS